MEIRPLTADDLPAVVRTAESAFHGDVAPWQLDVQRPVFEPARTSSIWRRMRAVRSPCRRWLGRTPTSVTPATGTTAPGTVSSRV